VSIESETIPKGKMANRESNIGPESNIKLGWVIALVLLIVVPPVVFGTRMSTQLEVITRLLTDLAGRVDRGEVNDRALENRVSQLEVVGSKPIRDHIEKLDIEMSQRVAKLEGECTIMQRTIRDMLIKSGQAGNQPSATGQPHEKDELSWLK
jgi:hypothetical protein